MTVQHFKRVLILVLYFNFSNWLSVKVKGYNLDRAINCWIFKDNLKNATLSPNIPSTHCKSVLIDDCTIPQCNSLCSKPRNPVTGELLKTSTNTSQSGTQNSKNKNQQYLG